MMPTPPLAFCSISALDRPLVAVAELAAAQSLEGIEVTAHTPHLDPEASLPSIRADGRAVREAGVGIIAYGSYLGRTGDRSPAQVQREVQIATALETSIFRMWAEPIPDAPEEGFGEAVSLVRQACDIAAADGLTVVVERHIGSFADTPERIQRLFAAVERPNLALNYQVLDVLRQEQAAEQPDDARRLIPLARYFHLKNYQPAQEAKEPMLPGASIAGGALDYRHILAATFEAGYAGPLTVEFLSFESRPVEEKLADDLAYLRGVLRELGRA
jgi:sugar phosphate isomerase/epimerase